MTGTVDASPWQTRSFPVASARTPKYFHPMQEVSRAGWPADNIARVFFYFSDLISAHWHCVPAASTL